MVLHVTFKGGIKPPGSPKKGAIFHKLLPIPVSMDKNILLIHKIANYMLLNKHPLSYKYSLSSTNINQLKLLYLNCIKLECIIHIKT